MKGNGSCEHFSLLINNLVIFFFCFLLSKHLIKVAWHSQDIQRPNCLHEKFNGFNYFVDVCSIDISQKDKYGAIKDLTFSFFL